MELCELSLRQYMSNRFDSITFADVFNILRDIIRAYMFFLTQSIVHRDMKPENILFLNLEERQIKVKTKL